MRLRHASLVLGALTVTGLIAGIVSLAVFATGEATPIAQQAIERCETLDKQQRFSEALAECDRAIEVDAEFAEAYVRRAAVFGEDSRARILDDALGEASELLTQSYIIVFRTGPFLTILNATFAGEANRAEAAELARTVDARIRGD